MKAYLTILLLLLPLISFPQNIENIQWKHISTASGELKTPNSGNQQTASLIADVDSDGFMEFFITERTAAPSVVMYKLFDGIWIQYIIDSTHLKIEAGSAKCDIDNDGDTDVVFGGDYKCNQVWWWENPYPELNPEIPWKRHIIKNSGKNQHHDQLFGDFDGDAKNELVFWNQKANTLFLAEIPKNPKSDNEWDFKPIYTYSGDSRMEPPGFLEGSNNSHEGLIKIDIDQDGIEDIVGGGRWFKYLEEGKFLDNIIDASYAYSRCIAGQLIEGGRPEVVLVVGDGVAPMFMYEWQKGTWVRTTIIPEVDHGHSLDLIDFNNDGYLDIFSGEMRLNGGNPDSKMRIFLGDGKGNFKEVLIAEGFGNHESRITDLDNDGDYDIVGKPYNWEAPRLDLWINMKK